MNSSTSHLSSAGPRETVEQCAIMAVMVCVFKVAKRPYREAAEAGLLLASMVRNGFEWGLS